MKVTAVGVGELAVSREEGVCLRAPGLGSCVAVVVHDPVSGVCGLVHVALPDSTLTREPSARQPGYYADLAFPILLETMVAEGASGAWHSYAVSLVGGASVLGKERIFDIGARNMTAIRRLLAELGIVPIAEEETGGTVARSVSVTVGTGEVTVTTAPVADTH